MIKKWIARQSRKRRLVLAIRKGMRKEPLVDFLGWEVKRSTKHNIETYLFGFLFVELPKILLLVFILKSCT